MKLKTLAVAGALAAFTTPAAATVVLFDDFNSQTPDQLNWTGDSMFLPTSPPGSVDLIGAGGSFDFFPGNGGYLDLDGSTGSGNDPAGEITSILSFGPGSYTLSFNLGGNRRTQAVRTTQFSLGNWSDSLSLAGNAGFGFYSYSFTTTSAGSLTFTQIGPSDNQGNILDNVKLSSAVPEPATWAMMIVGFGLAGSAVRSTRRRQALAAA